MHFANPVGPGWANPETGRFDDTRLKGRDGKPYGPLPRAWAQYKGMYHYGNQVILSYTVGDGENSGNARLRAGARREGRLHAHVEHRQITARPARCASRPRERPSHWSATRATLEEKDGYTLLRIPAAATPLALKLLLSDGEPRCTTGIREDFAAARLAWSRSRRAAHRRWPEVLKTQAVVGGDTPGIRHRCADASGEQSRGIARCG